MGKYVYYRGRVQGVGFRATVRGIARGYAVRGWVRNLADGGVELLAAGPDEAVNAFLAEIRDRFAQNITAEEMVETETDPGEGFTIIY